MKDENKKIARLIKQIQRGNQSAFEEFYKLTSPKAYFIALKITQNEHDAEDILQESYIKALEKINEIDTSQNVNSWFLKIVSNKSKDLLKSKNRLIFEGEEETIFEEIPEDKTEFSPEENLNQEELRLEVMAAIDELTAEKRACIMMMYFGDMSVKEIAESIEVPESTVKNRLHTARKDLKTKFEKNGNILYGAALGGVLIWALNKTSVTASAAFLASAASAEIVAGATASYTTGATASAATATTAATSTAASAGTGIAAKIAVASVAQKIAVGVAATAVIGGSTAGVVTVVKNSTPEETTTQVIEEVTTAPAFITEYVFNEMTLPETTTEIDFSTEKETVKDTTRAITKHTSTKEYTTVPASTTKAVTKKETPTITTTTREKTTTRKVTTTRRETTTQKPATTTRPTTTTVLTTAESTTVVTAAPTTTEPTTVTTTESTTEPTTQAPATVNVEVIDMNEDVVATFSFTVEAGTEMTWEYLVTQIKSEGYEPKAGVYGDAVDAVAESGTVYTITAEL